MDRVVVEHVRATPEELQPGETGWEDALRWAEVPLLIEVGGLAALVVLIFIFPAPGVAKAAAVGIAVAALLGKLAARQWLARRQLKFHRSTASGSQASTYVIDHQGLAIGNMYAESRTYWSAMRGVIRYPNRYVFLFTPAHNPVLPRRLLTPEQDAALQALIAGAGVTITDGPPPGVD
jgi:hypothetical protein